MSKDFKTVNCLPFRKIPKEDVGFVANTATSTASTVLNLRNPVPFGHLPMSTIKLHGITTKDKKNRRTSNKIYSYLVTWWRTGTKDCTSPNLENSCLTSTLSISKGGLLMKVVLCKSSSASIVLSMSSR